MDSNEFYRNFYQHPGYGNRGNQKAFNSGNNVDGYPGLQGAIHNLMGYRNHNHLVQGCEVTADLDGTTLTIDITSGIGFVSGEFVNIDATGIIYFGITPDQTTAVSLGDAGVVINRPMVETGINGPYLAKFYESEDKLVDMREGDFTDDSGTFFERVSRNMLFNDTLTFTNPILRFESGTTLELRDNFDKETIDYSNTNSAGIYVINNRPVFKDGIGIGDGSSTHIYLDKSSNLFLTNASGIGVIGGDAEISHDGTDFSVTNGIGDVILQAGNRFKSSDYTGVKATLDTGTFGYATGDNLNFPSGTITTLSSNLVTGATVEATNIETSVIDSNITDRPVKIGNIWYVNSADEWENMFITYVPTPGDTIMLNGNWTSTTSVGVNVDSIHIIGVRNVPSVAIVNITSDYVTLTNVSLNKGLTISGDFCTIDGIYSVISGASVTSISITGDYTRVNNSFIDNNATSVGIGIDISSTAAHTYIYNNKINTDSTVYAIDISGDYNTIIGNDIHHDAGTGIYTDASSTYANVVGNIVITDSGTSINVSAGTGHNSDENITV